MTESHTTYSVSGATLQDVADAISHLPEAGKCEWHPTYTYTTGADGKVDSFTVVVPYTIEMPVWSDYSSASAAAQAEWDRWHAALAAHEQGHIEATYWVFDMEDSMIGLTPHEAGELFGKFTYDAQQCSDRYDAENNHGLLAGTVMDTSIT